MSSTVRLLIADDHAGVRRGLRTFLVSEPNIEVLGEVIDGSMVVERARVLQPDILLLDMSMPNLHGLQVIEQLQRVVPSPRIIVLTAFAEESNMFPAMRAGAFGYVLKDVTPQRLVQVIHETHRGEATMPPAVAVKLIRDLSQHSRLPPTTAPLTTREFELLRLLAHGASTYELTQHLSVDDHSVNQVIGQILSKVHTASTTGTALFVQSDADGPQ